MPEKLVRDHIPDIIRSNGLEPEVYQADAAEFRQRLRDKLQEEVDEVLAAADPESLLEELADVLEVLVAMAANIGVDEQGLRLVAQRKAMLRGGFREKFVWTGNRPANVTALG